MDQIIPTSAAVAVAFMLSVLVLKITAFALGYLIVRLGHDTMIKGVTGEIDFGFSGGGVQAKLKSATPGALFVLAGAAIIIWGLTVSKPFNFQAVQKPAVTRIEIAPDTSAAPDYPELPPPKK